MALETATDADGVAIAVGNTVNVVGVITAIHLDATHFNSVTIAFDDPVTGAVNTLTVDTKQVTKV